MTSIRPEFAQFIGKPISQDRVVTVASSAGPVEDGLQDFFKKTARVSEFLGLDEKALEPHKDELEALIKPSESKEQQKLLREIGANLPSGSPNLIPTRVESGQNGMFKVDFHRVSETWDSIKEPQGVREKAAVLYIDTTPGQPGVTVYSESFAPTTRPVFASSDIHSREMVACSPDNPLKSALPTYMKLATDYVQADVSGDHAALARLDQAGKAAEADPNMEAAQAFLKSASDRLTSGYNGPAPWATPVNLQHHGEGIYSLEIRQWFPTEALNLDFGGDKQPARDRGSSGDYKSTLWIDTRPGLPGIEYGKSWKERT